MFTYCKYVVYHNAVIVYLAYTVLRQGLRTQTSIFSL